MSNDHRSFWATLPGLLAALATLITAVSGIMGYKAFAGTDGGKIAPSSTTTTTAATTTTRPSSDRDGSPGTTRPTVSRPTSTTTTTTSTTLPRPRDLCKTGYVWREARVSDHVCVTPATRAQTAEDNQQAFSRWISVGCISGQYGPNTCVDGYVWRDAFSGDDVCVFPSVRSQAAADNAQASSRLQ